MCFGFDPRDKGSAKIYYYDNTNDFTLLDIPNDISDEYIIPETNIKFHSKKSYPDQEEFETLNNTKIDIEEYENVLEKIGVNIDDEYEHKLLGYANTVQGEMLTEAERISVIFIVVIRKVIETLQKKYKIKSKSMLMIGFYYFN